MRPFEALLLRVEQIDGQALGPQRRAHRAREMAQQGRQVDGGAQRAARLTNRPRVVVRLAVEIAIERALDLTLQGREEYRNEQRQEDLADRQLMLVVEERVRGHEEREEGHARHEDGGQIHDPATHFHADVHQAMADDRVADHEDHDEREEGAELAVPTPKTTGTSRL